MSSVLYSWLCSATVAPFVVILSYWTLAVVHSHQVEWRQPDAFLLTLTALEGTFALFAFGYSVLGAIGPPLEAPCAFFLWGMTTVRTFHLSTVTSLLVDRALRHKWTAAYRTSVRRSQVRYHIAVLGVISVFVGVTSVFARQPSLVDRCSLYPLEWNLKFSAFFAFIYGLLLITGVVCYGVVQVSRTGSRSTYRTSFSRGSRNNGGSSEDREWTAAGCISVIAYLINHGPYLVINSLGMCVPDFWSPWSDSIVVWLQLVQGLLVPCILIAADTPHRNALKNMLRQPGRIYRHLSDQGGFHLRIGESPSKSSVPFLVYRNRMFPQRLRWCPASFPSLQSLQPLDMDSLRRSYGSGDYTTLLSLPSSTTSFHSPCSSMTSGSVTTDAVDDFVFRRPSVLPLFDPQPPSENGSSERCNTPFSQKSTYSDDPMTKSADAYSCKVDARQDLHSCAEVIVQIPGNENRINIIMNSKSSPTETDDSHLSDLSSEPSDTDSVQSVIIRQRVDQSGKVLESDITIAQRKLVRCNPQKILVHSERL